MAALVLKRAPLDRLRAGHPWIYRGEIADLRGAWSPGDIVDVLDAAGHLVGRGTYNPRTSLACRLFTHREVVDEALVVRRVAAALAYRRTAGLEADAFRLVWSEADGLPGLVADAYGPVTVAQCLTLGMSRLMPWVAAALAEARPGSRLYRLDDAAAARIEGFAPERGWLVQASAGAARAGGQEHRAGTSAPGAREVAAEGVRVERASVESASVESAPGESASVEATLADVETVWSAAAAEAPVAGAVVGETADGRAAADVIVSEGPCRFAVTLGEGHKTGLYLDQRENRPAVAAHAGGRRVLDAFCYTGAFACHALRAGAAGALLVDSSAEALSGARRNLGLNGVADRAELRQANAFDELRQLEARRERFGLVVLDPPPFTRRKDALDAAARGYKEINLRALRLLGPGGILVTCSCSHHVSEATFLELVAEAALDAHRTLRVLERRTQSQDHPILLTVPETHYLKCLILEVI